jgi:glycosyltransferase involved in cell wall biosynthesis
LESPIAHHAYAERVLREEAQRNPQWAPYLQYHDLPRRIKRRYEAEIAEADLILTLSSIHKRSFEEVGVTSRKLAVTPLGVDAELFQPAESTRTDRPFRVLFVGQLNQRKGLSYLIEAFDQAAIPGSELVLAGGGNTPRPINGRSDIRIMAHRPRHDLPSVYRQADCFVLPSLIEGFALTALEAMACGLPVILSDHTFGTDVVEDGVSGFVVPAGDSVAIAERLTVLWADADLRHRMARAARETALDYSWQEYGRRVAATLSLRLGL